MAEAVRLARRGLYTTDPNPRVGCLLVKKNSIIARGWHQKAGEEHAEIRTIKEAGSSAAGSSLYINLEPCCWTGRTPPCTEALVKARIHSVYAAMLDPHPQVSGKGIALLRQAGIRVSLGYLAEQARELNKGFVKRWEKGLPWVRCKLAMGLEGAMGEKEREETGQWITGAAAREDVHKWRARSSAIITSGATVRADDALLTARLKEKEVKQPLRVLMDSDFNLPPSARFFTQGEEILWVGAEDASPPKPRKKVRIYRLPRRKNGLCLRSLLSHLAQLEMNEVMVEAGPRLTASFLSQNLVDELVLYVAPRVLAADSAAFLRLNSGGRSFRWRDLRFFAQDLRLVLVEDENAKVY